MGFAMTKNHPFIPKISKLITEYLANGTFTEIYERHVNDKCPSTKSWSTLPRADLTKMKGLLLVTLGFAIFGSGVILFESVCPPKRRKKKVWTTKIQKIGGC